MGTAQDVLLAELLGDVGKLSDAIKNLPSELKTTLSPTIKMINLVNKDAQEATKNLVASQKLEIEAVTGQYKIMLLNDVQDAIQAHFDKGLSKTNKQLENIYNAHYSAINALKKQNQKIALVAFLSCAAGCLFSFTVAYFIFR